MPLSPCIFGQKYFFQHYFSSSDIHLYIAHLKGKLLKLFGFGSTNLSPPIGNVQSQAEQIPQSLIYTHHHHHNNHHHQHHHPHHYYGAINGQAAGLSGKKITLGCHKGIRLVQGAANKFIKIAYSVSRG